MPKFSHDVKVKAASKNVKNGENIWATGASPHPQKFGHFRTPKSIHNGTFPHHDCFLISFYSQHRKNILSYLFIIVIIGNIPAYSYPLLLQDETRILTPAPRLLGCL
jgi:hypothetical protein